MPAPDGALIAKSILEPSWFVDLAHDHRVQHDDGEVGYNLHKYEFRPEYIVRNVHGVRSQSSLCDAPFFEVVTELEKLGHIVDHGDQNGKRSESSFPAKVTQRVHYGKVSVMRAGTRKQWTK